MSIYRGRTKKEFYLASLLYDSIEDRDLQSIKTLLVEKGADPNLVLHKKGISPFHLAIGLDSNDFAIILTNLILQHGGNPNIKSDDGLTPIHIAAAWGRLEILQLLLSCGGDPEVRDINMKTALHYAKEENFKECLELLRAFVPNRNEFIYNNSEEPLGYHLVLDKILVNAGVEMGEYEIVSAFEPTNSIIKKEALSLPMLPQPSDTTEYVMNWFNKHVDQNQRFDSNPVYATSERKNSETSSTEGLESFESSVDESDVEVTKPMDTQYITFRKVYRKTRSIKKDSSGSGGSPGKINEISSYVDALEFQEGDKSTYEFTNLEQFSKESGILTLPSSTKDDSFLFQETNAEKSIKNDASKNDATKKDCSNNDTIIISDESTNTSNKELKSDTSTNDASKNDLNKNISNKNDASSDYMTCSLHSNEMEKNIFELTEDLSILQSTKAESTEISFVSVSEIYKYVDEDQGVVLFERRLLKSPSSEYCGSIKSSFSSKMSSVPGTIDYDTDTLRKELTLHGFKPGPITVTTKRVYVKQLRRLKKEPLVAPPVNEQSNKKVFSIELEKTLRDPSWYNNVANYKCLEEQVCKQFSNPDPSRKWREGVNKGSFTYLLLDPRVTSNLPCRAELMQPQEIWETFLSAIFYVGKGKRSRPYSHLYEAVALWNKNEYKTSNKKLQHILDIWKNDTGVICVHIFQNIIPVEAYTREAAMIAALKLENVRNAKLGDFYGIAATWPQKQKRMFGVYILYKAMMIFLNEGERQLCPKDID